MSSDLAAAADTPAWLWWAGGASIAACLGVAGLLGGRLRGGRPLVASRPQRPVPWNGGDVAVILFLGLSGALAVNAALGPDPPLDAQLAGNIAFVALATLAAIGWLVARGGTAADLGLAPNRLADDWRLAVAGLALVVPPLLALAAVLNQLVPYTHPVVEFLAERRDATAVGLVVVAAVLAAPVAEEFFFRRVLQGWLEKRLTDADGGLAITISAAAFALAHQGQGLAFVPLFPLGLVLGFIARRTGSIVPCILLHALFNAVSVGLLLATPAPRPAAEKSAYSADDSSPGGRQTDLVPEGRFRSQFLHAAGCGACPVTDSTLWPLLPPAALPPGAPTWPHTWPSGWPSA